MPSKFSERFSSVSNNGIIHNIIDLKTEYDENDHAIRQKTVASSLPPSPLCKDKFQKTKKTVSDTLIPTTKPLTPHGASPLIVTSRDLSLNTMKRQKDIRDKDIYFAIKWACGILTVAASIVFGIWAPLSYEATISDNETQESMLSVLSNAKEMASTANIIALNALDTASVQHEAIGSL